MRKLDPDERSVPTKALMTGYKLLESAVKDKDCYVDPAEVVEVLEDLHESFEHLLEDSSPSIPTIEPTPPPEPSGEYELDLIEAAKRAEADEPVGYDGVLTQTSSLEGMEQRILIVDDVDTIAASVGFVLSDLDLPIDIASHGVEALEMLKERPYSLIISDVAMPRMDGIALTRVVRAEQELQDIPLILLTSLDHPSERDAGFDAGANDYIIKGSIGGGELVNRVRELLKIAPFVPRESPKRKTRQRILVAEDAETVAASIAFLLSAGDYDITLTSNGHEALTRLEREDFDLLISDWQMPSMTGDELARAVRASAHIKQIPIILLTSLDSDEVRQQGREAGANKFLVKGKIGGGALLDIVSELLDAAR
jgi:CheY-like chemotaxis protein